ncbi:3-methyladenine DNA glycosylase [Galbitalea sp. SE-J8]|uniref:3-methyladenine DNA glycosylase n=1 Tax=Galbitalea sp. SE-J8 TaxID=3054952 RepID=UPI00259C9BA1|nr:3-methyladenine DNA glycosylase [Galbitalea sp. SE-J8]MDM4762652.1 3-methyladenine DNA glycosylase [Galbitalea sp. SE-J8]
MPTASAPFAIRETLDAAAWRARAASHAERADAMTAGWRARAGTGRTHPVEDFLFTYYPYKPAQLRKWHPGAGVALADAAERAQWAFYAVDDDDVAHVDGAAFVERHGRNVGFIASLLERTAGRTANLACFGLHEWAMVYRAEEHRHAVPLRLGQTGTDAVVQQHRIACSHVDAFRFFTAAAVPLNRLQPTRENQPDLEQPGCLHAGMDLYKWATKLGPLVPGELLLDCFELARDIRDLDMRASPYDLADLGYAPVPIETPAGRAAYSRAQRGFAERGAALRARLIAAARA